MGSQINGNSTNGYFIQWYVRANNKENIKAPYQWHFVHEFPLQSPYKGQIIYNS